MEVGIKVLEVADPTLQVRACMNFTSCVHMCARMCACVSVHMCVCVYARVCPCLCACVYRSLWSQKLCWM